jgi:ribonuclease Z
MAAWLERGGVMQVITLGTGSPLPDPERAGPATLVRAAGRDLLFDCGRGVLMRASAVGIGPLSFDTVFITHLHSDHITDFNDIVTTRWVMSPTPNPLRVIGPAGTQNLVDRTIEMLRDDIGYRLAHHSNLDWEPACDVIEVSDGPVIDDGEIRVTAAPTDHAPVRPSLGYRVEAGGKAVVIAGDTVPCEGLDRLCAGADVYVQTVLRRSIVEAVPIARLQDILDYHSSIEDAASTAARAGVSILVITHLIPAPWPGSEGEWVAEAARVFSGEIVLAHDLWELDL